MEELTEGEAEAIGLVYLSTTSTTTLGTTGLAIFGTFKLSGNNNEEAQAYLQERETDVITGLATGEGPFIEEVFEALKVEERERMVFTQRLVMRYTELAGLANVDHLTPDRARRFFDLIIEMRTQL